MTWSWGSYSTRSTLHERRDTPTISDSDLESLLAFQQFQGRLLGGHGPILDFLASSKPLWPVGGPITILDVRCGLGSLARAIASWAKRNKIEIQIYSIDTYSRVVSYAKEESASYKNITFEARTLKDPMFLQAQQFDYVVSDGALHSCDNAEVEHTLITLNRLAKRGVAITDFLRDFRAAFWMTLLARFTRNAEVLHDAELCIRRGFTLKEMMNYCNKAGLKYAVLQKEFGYRFSLLGERTMVLAGDYKRVAGFAGA